MFRNILLIACTSCLFFTVAASAQNADFTAQELSGTYSISDVFVSQNITLKTDGTYSSISTSDVCETASAESRDCLNYPIESGNFIVSGSVVKFNPVSYRYYEKGKLITDLPPVYEFFAVKWSERFYLIEKDSLKSFADAINLSLEPRRNNFGGRGRDFLLRREGVDKPVVGLPNLPDGWNDFLLKKPVTAIVLKIEKRGGESFVEINKGTNDGLKIGIKLVANRTLVIGEIISLKKSSATVKLKKDAFSEKINLKVGDKLQTDQIPVENIILESLDIK